MYLRQLGLEFEERNPDQDMEVRKEFMRLKLPGVPSFIVDDQVVIGLSKLKDYMEQN